MDVLRGRIGDGQKRRVKMNPQSASSRKPRTQKRVLRTGLYGSRLDEIREKDEC